MYVVVACYKCGELALVHSRQKTKRCPYCGSRFNIERSKKLAYAKSARKASMILRRLKINLKRKRS